MASGRPYPRSSSGCDTPEESRRSGVEGASDSKTAFSLRQRLAIAAISAAGGLALRLIGPTLRYSVTIEDGGPAEPLEVPAVYAFWHQCVFAAAWFFRKREIAVMTSRSFDGEYIARMIEGLGFRAVRGSSSRGAVGALLGMRDEVAAGHTAAFTIDGPRGPRFVAKPGPVLLAKTTGKPLICFHIAAKNAWRLKSWDGTVIPKPFSRVHLEVSRRIIVPSTASDVQMEELQSEMQQTLERVQRTAESVFKAGSQS